MHEKAMNTLYTEYLNVCCITCMIETEMLNYTYKSRLNATYYSRISMCSANN